MDRGVVSYPLQTLVLVVRGLLDAVGMVLEGGITPGVVLLLFGQGSMESIYKGRRTITNAESEIARQLSGKRNFRARVQSGDTIC